VLHRFTGGTDGALPRAGLVEVGGALYGTTSGRGTSGGGTVFKITTSGHLTALHQFGGSGDGSIPLAGLLNVNGTLYGTTDEFIGNGLGAVYSITTSGAESVVCIWPSTNHNSGSQPMASLIDVGGALYGTTEAGGSTPDGTVFATPL
jgi:uncharacterized repeat protein (TIGR03803 family)